MKTLVATFLFSVVCAAPSLAASGSGAVSPRCPDEQAALDSKPGISPSERQAVRTKTFDALDQDKNGEVSRAEYVNCLVKSPAFDAAGQGAKSVK